MTIKIEAATRLAEMAMPTIKRKLGVQWGLKRKAKSKKSTINDVVTPAVQKKKTLKPKTKVKP